MTLNICNEVISDTRLFMNCVFGNPLSEEQLLTEDDPDILDHLKRCPFCAGRLHELQEFEFHLLDRLHPDSQLLLDFSFGLLAKTEAKSITEGRPTYPVKDETN